MNAERPSNASTATNSDSISHVSVSDIEMLNTKYDSKPPKLVRKSMSYYNPPPPTINTSHRLGGFSRSLMNLGPKSKPEDQESVRLLDKSQQNKKYIME
jgi:hypothetical protein